ncbi:MAG TPA: hypothetical protein PK950_02725 [Candidatus Paceibacterota bacterium]|nr:hypothetical protein [Candidatus Paceibacterota bacterium]
MTKNFTKYIHSFIAIPILAFSLPSASLPSGITLNLTSQFNTSTAVVEDNTPDLTEYRAELIDSYYEAKKLPMAGYGKLMVEAADKYDIDWRLLPALAVRESTAGKQACGGKLSAEWNPWGWNSCKGDGFSSMEESVDMIAKHISGNHERTARYYKKKQGDVKGILQVYNPPSVVATYAQEVMGIMSKISPSEDVTVAATAAHILAKETAKVEVALVK